MTVIDTTAPTLAPPADLTVEGNTIGGADADIKVDINGVATIYKLTPGATKDVNIPLPTDGSAVVVTITSGGEQLAKKTLNYEPCPYPGPGASILDYPCDATSTTAVLTNSGTANAPFNVSI